MPFAVEKQNGVGTPNSDREHTADRIEGDTLRSVADRDDQPRRRRRQRCGSGLGDWVGAA
jgi:hypothetical protein